jgi:hypothetical protein
MKSVLVVGGYGVFGTQVCRGLAERGVPVTVAGRDGARAEAFARTLGPGCRGQGMDADDLASCRAALDGHDVAVGCAGPFRRDSAALLQACLEARCHYADISDDRYHAALVRSHDRRCRARGLVAAPGCSSLPGISGALALLAGEGTTSPVRRVRVTLFVGNHNPKGEATVQSVLTGLGQPIAAPQGVIYGFRDREVVPLPPPYGRRPVFNFASPDYDLLPSLLGTHSVSVKLGFELSAATYGFALLAVLRLGYGPRTARLLQLPAGLLGRFGSSGGAVMAELFLADGTQRRAALLAGQEGQRMAALPCVLAAQALHEGRFPGPGVMTAYELLGARPLVEALTAAGFELHRL